MEELVKLSEELISLIPIISLLTSETTSLLTSTSLVNSQAEIDPTLIKNKIAKIKANFKFL
ncbi:MAG: hypothetical protein MJ224_02545 [archaeon]|nr:hypothetical protein [archaeon]